MNYTTKLLFWRILLIFLFKILFFTFRPELPPSVDVTWEDRFYPKAWGHPLLREAIVNMYNDHYGSKIEPDNVMIFAGGRCAIFTTLLFLKKADTKMQNSSKISKTKKYLVNDLFFV